MTDTRKTFVIDDGFSSPMKFNANSVEDAIRKYSEGGFDQESKTYWVQVTITDEEGEIWDHTYTCHPAEPDCANDHKHDWRSPHSVVGGLKENPGVWSHGGGVVVHDVCKHCRTLRITDTWAQDPHTGQQGLESVRYVEPGDEDYWPTWPGDDD